MKFSKKLDFWSYALIASVVVFLVVVVLFSMGNNQYQQSLSNILVNKNPSLIKIGNADYFVSLYKSDAASGIAYIYMQQPPSMFNKGTIIKVSNGIVTPINTNRNSSYSNLEIKLNSLSNNSASISMEIINTSIMVPVNNSDISYNNVNNATTTTIIIQNSTIKTSTTISQTTIATTTTIKNTNLLDAISILSNNQTYALMLNYSIAYNNAHVSCSPTEYNSTYDSNKGSLPSGPETYKNATNVTPYNMTLSTTNSSPTAYTVIFTTHSYNPVATGKVAIFNINTATSTISSSFSGIFSGMSYSQLYNDYQGSIALGNCGILIN